MDARDRLARDKREIYRQARAEIAALLAPGGEASGAPAVDPIAAMASCAAVLHARLPTASWTGFYRVVAPAHLRIGPYQGPVGCLEIPFARGVCGAAARSGEAQVVADVRAFPDHLACDAAARSEIVLPVRDRHGVLVAVLDLDSHQLAAFDEIDREELTPIAALVGAAWPI